MRLTVLTLVGAAMLAGCEPAEPGAAAPAGSASIPPPRPALSAEPGPDIDWSPAAQQGESAEGRRQAEAAMRELDQRAATLGTDIAAARTRADEAVRTATPSSAAAPAPTPTRSEPTPSAASAAPSQPAPAQLPPSKPAG